MHRCAAVWCRTDSLCTAAHIADRCPSVVSSHTRVAVQALLLTEHLLKNSSQHVVQVRCA